MTKTIYLYLLLSLSSTLLLGQNKFTVSGYVTDKDNGESLFGANIYDKSQATNGTMTNAYGFYSLTLEEGNYTLVFSSLGFENQEMTVQLTSDQTINVTLESETHQVEEVVVSADGQKNEASDTRMSQVKLQVETIKSIPSLMGEIDVLKTIQLLPGVSSSGEGNAGFYVRGGGPDQNLILLDEATVYNAAHLFGFFSVFNADAIKDVNLTKGGMPAQFGGRLASVLEITMKDGNMKKHEFEGGIGLISSRFTAQGPIVKDKASFIVSGRRTYIDVITKPFIPETSRIYGSGYYFYDLNTKLNYKISDKDRLYLSGYFGRDVFNFSDNKANFSADIPWGNATTSLRWNHLFSNKLFLNTSLIFSDYEFEFGAEQSQFEFRLFSGITDYNTKIDFNWYPGSKHNVKFGNHYTWHTFVPSNATARSGDVDFDMGKIIKQYAHEVGLYINDEIEVTERFNLNLGLRYSYFAQVGPFDRFIKDEYGKTTDTLVYNKGDLVADYGGLEPRVSFRFLLNDISSIKGSFTQNYQYIHLANVSSVSMPTDIWMPSSDKIAPQKGTQYALGYFRSLFKDQVDASAEVYYKNMNNMVEYGVGTAPDENVNDNPDNNLVQGNGVSYGLELFLKKKTGKFNGWIGYTLSKTERTFKDINGGKTYPAKYDRRHDLSIVGSFQINKRMDLSSTFVYATGNAMTMAIGRYFIDFTPISVFGEQNSYRMAPYHRLDLSLTLKAKPNKKLKSSWNFSVYNVYNRKNPYFIYFDSEGDLAEGDYRIQAKQMTLFPIIPSITWNFKF